MSGKTKKKIKNMKRKIIYTEKHKQKLIKQQQTDKQTMVKSEHKKNYIRCKKHRTNGVGWYRKVSYFFLCIIAQKKRKKKKIKKKSHEKQRCLSSFLFLSLS